MTLKQFLKRAVIKMQEDEFNNATISAIQFKTTKLPPQHLNTISDIKINELVIIYTDAKDNLGTLKLTDFKPATIS